MAPGLVVGLGARLVVVPEGLHRGRVPLVALGASAVLLQAQRIALQVARDVLEALPRRAREEARVDEPLARGLHFLHHAPEARMLRHGLAVLLARLHDGREVPQRRLRHRRQPRLGALLLLLEPLGRARRLVLADERAVHDGLDQVRLELVRGYRRLELHRDGVEAGQPPLELAQLLLELQGHEGLDPFAVFVEGTISCIEQPYRRRLSIDRR